MALRKQAEPGDRVTLSPHTRGTAPSRAYQGGTGQVRSYDPVFRTYTVDLDDGTTITLSGDHLVREDLGYGRKTRS